jgi:site-specific DNA recombinase
MGRHAGDELHSGEDPRNEAGVDGYGITRPGAIYCRTPLAREVDQVTVAAQERACRELARRLEIAVPHQHTYADNYRSAWQRNRPRPAWRAMLASIRSGLVDHALLYRPDWYLGEPCDLAELLRLADRHSVALHWCVDEIGMTDPDIRRRIVAEASRQCSRRRATGRVARSAHDEAAAAGRPHGGGRRAYGYTAYQYELIDSEAAVVREVYARFLAGESIRGVALDLNGRGIPTAYGGAWSAHRVARLLDAPRYAGLRPLRGEVAKTGDGQWQAGNWQPCVSVADWECAQQLRRRRFADQQTRQRPAREYPLTGLVVCAACDRHMVGTMIGTFATYACTANSLLTARRCSRHIAAGRLEAFVEERVLTTLSTLDGNGWRPRDGSSHASTGTIAVAGIEDLVDGLRHDAPGTWGRLSSRRKASVLRRLFAAIRIGPKNTPRNVFDYERISFVESRD